MKNSVLFLSNAYPDFDSSYRGVFIERMASLLKKEGYEICVVTPKIFRESHYFENQNGIKVYRFPFFSGNKLLIEYSKIPYLRMILYYITGFFVSVYASIKHHCRLIHVHWAIPTGLIGVLVAGLLRKPLIVTIHGSDFRLAIEKGGVLKKLFIWVCKRADYLHCVSEVQKKEIEQLGIRNKKISIIPMGVDEAFLEMGKNRKMRLEKRPSTILNNRNLLPVYNVSLLIRAIPIVLKEEPKTKFLIAGDGSEKENLKSEVENLNLSASVQFLGRVPHKEMPNLLAQADIYVSTSLYDGTSVSLLEALGSGAFPVVTDIPSNREWITDGNNGFLVPINEAGILASRILDAIRNRDLLEKSRSDNLLIVEKKAFWPTNIKKFERIYSSL